MKLILLGLWFFYITLLGENVFAQKHEIENNEHILNKSYDEHNFVSKINKKRTKRQTEQDNDEFIKQLSNIAMKAINVLSNYGHKLIEVEKIDNVSRAFDQNKIKITACRFNDLNQKDEISKHSDKNVTLNDFFVCDVCQVTINKSENNIYSAIETSCVLHDSRFLNRAPEVI